MKLIAVVVGWIKIQINRIGLVNISMLIGVAVLSLAICTGGIWYSSRQETVELHHVRLYEGPEIEGVRSSLTSKAPALVPMTSKSCSQDILHGIPNVEVPSVAAQLCTNYVYIGVESWIEQVDTYRESWPNYREYELPGFVAFEFGNGGQAMLINDNRDLAIYVRYDKDHASNPLLDESFRVEGSFEKFVQRMRV